MSSNMVMTGNRSFGAVDPSEADRFSSRLTMSPRKWELYRDEPGFKIACCGLLAEAGPAVVDSLQRYAILAVKPEGWIDGVFPRVAAFLPRHGFEIVGMFRSRLTPTMIREIWRYQWNIAPVERIELSELLLSLGPLYGFLLRDTAPVDGTPASVRLARLKGPAIPARQRPGQLRRELGAPCRLVTYVHIPDEPADIIRDLSVMLDRAEMVRLLARTLDGPPAPLRIDPARLSDVARVDDSLPGGGPVGAPGDSLWRRALLMKAAFAAHVPADHLDADRLPADHGDGGGVVRLPRDLWTAMLDLCADVSELPTPGEKRVEPLADIRPEPPAEPRSEPRAGSRPGTGAASPRQDGGES
ncbi:hypothetical protein ACH35V_38500 [Actinomadura sp. 1N219]|uniref:hypothetical protein n=1 Tax=Actinomadura sp. 1N219 TaxID=3375152 RepID=UPI0037BA23C8